MRSESLRQGKGSNEFREDEPDYTRFKAKPLKPGPFVDPTVESVFQFLSSSSENPQLRSLDILFTEGRARIHGEWKFGPKSPYKKNALIQTRGLGQYLINTAPQQSLSFDYGDFGLAIILEVDQAAKTMDVQVVEEFNNRVRHLTEEETRRFEQHESLTMPKGEKLLGRFDEVKDSNTMPIPPYVNDDAQEFFFTIEDSSGMIRVAQATRVSGTEVTFSRAD